MAQFGVKNTDKARVKEQGLRMRVHPSSLLMAFAVMHILDPHSLLLFLALHPRPSPFNLNPNSPLLTLMGAHIRPHP